MEYMSAFKFLNYLLLLKPFYTYRTCPMAFFHYHCLYFLRVSHLHWHFDGDWWHWLQNNKELIIIIFVFNLFKLLLLYTPYFDHSWPKQYQRKLFCFIFAIFGGIFRRIYGLLWWWDHFTRAIFWFFSHLSL